jgi:hypothetical protein
MTAALLLLPLAACGSGKEDPGGVSPSESRQLNDAAAMLDANSVSAETVDVPGPDEPQGNTQ